MKDKLDQSTCCEARNLPHRPAEAVCSIRPTDIRRTHGCHILMFRLVAMCFLCS